MCGSELTIAKISALLKWFLATVDTTIKLNVSIWSEHFSAGCITACTP